MEKKCPRCKIVKDFSQYSRSSVRLDKKSVYCKACEKTYKDKKNAEKKFNELYGII